MAGVHWHDYGKSPRAGRKVGHATAVAENARGLESQLIALGQALGREASYSAATDDAQGAGRGLWGNC